jgi:hypothetical protein
MTFILILKTTLDTHSGKSGETTPPSNQKVVTDTIQQTDVVPTVSALPVSTTLPNNTFISPLVYDGSRKFKFTLKVPNTWKILGYGSQGDSYGISFEKKGVRINIDQPEGWSPENCYFDRDVNNSQSLTIINYQEIDTNFGKLRIATPSKTNSPDETIIKTFVCGINSGSWTNNTKIGRINILLATDFDTNAYSEVSSILKQITISY